MQMSIGKYLSEMFKGSKPSGAGQHLNNLATSTDPAYLRLSDFTGRDRKRATKKGQGRGAFGSIRPNPRWFLRRRNKLLTQKMKIGV